MKHLIKKLLREGLMGESEMKTAQEVGLSDNIFYHGTTMKIDKLDPEFRQNNRDAMGSKTSGSANHGVGIYFSSDIGFDPNNLTYANSGGVVNTGGGGENAYKWAYNGNPGFIYKMKLKATANIVDEGYDKVSDIKHRSIEMDKYKELRNHGVDAVWGGHELTLLNPDAIEAFKLEYRIEDKYKFRDKLLSKDELEPALKQMIGDKYNKMNKAFRDGGKIYYKYIDSKHQDHNVYTLPNQVISV